MGHSVKRIYRCSIEKDKNIIAESSNNMNTGFVNLFCSMTDLGLTRLGA
jgi:hypothetical protein